MDSHDVLCRALNVLERDGWKQANEKGVMYPPGHCIYTAIKHSTQDQWEQWEACEVLTDLLGIDKPEGIPKLEELFAWQDDPIRTWEQIKSLLIEGIRETAPEPNPTLTREDPPYVIVREPLADWVDAWEGEFS